MFSTKEMEMIYVACMEMGDKLSNMARELERFAEAHPDILVGKVNIEEPENVQLAVSLGVNSIPALFFYRDGKLVKQLVGFMKKSELESKLGL